MEPRLLFSNDEAAELLHMAPRTLANFRANGKGPKYYKTARRVSYQLADLQSYIQNNIFDPVDESADFPVLTNTGSDPEYISESNPSGLTEINPGR